MEARRPLFFTAAAIVLSSLFSCADFAGDGSALGYYHLYRRDQSRVLFSPSTGIITAEPAVSATVSVTLQYQPQFNVTIQGITSSNTGEVTVSPTSLTFTPENFAIPQVITLTGVDDFVSDGPQTYQITFGATQSDDPYYAEYSIPALTGVNSDEDSAGINVTPTSGLVTTEAGGTATFSVTLNSEPVANVVIPLSVDDATEVSLDKASLTFTPANWNVAQIVTATGVDDFLDDGNMGFTALVQPATSSDPVYQGLDGADVTGTNNDNDAAAVTVTANGCGLFTYEETGPTDTFTVQLASEPYGTVTIPVASSNTNEATVSPASLTFLPGNWNTAQTVTVTGVDGFGGASTDVAYTINMGPASSPGNADYDGRTITGVSGINLHNTPGVAIRSTCVDNTTGENLSTGSFYISLRSAPSASVVLTPVSSNPLEGTVAGTFTFTTGNWYTRQMVTVTGVNDDVDDGNQVYSISFSAAGPAPYNVVMPESQTLTNADNDTAGITFITGGTLVTTEAGGTDTFTVVLNSEPTANVTITFGTDDATEGLVTSGSSGLPAVFTSANWNVAQTITVTGQADDGDGPASTTAYNVTISVASGDAKYNVLTPANLPATNND